MLITGLEYFTVTWGSGNLETNILLVSVYDDTQVSMTFPSGFGSVTVPDGVMYGEGQTLQVHIYMYLKCHSRIRRSFGKRARC